MIYLFRSKMNDSGVGNFLQPLQIVVVMIFPSFQLPDELRGRVLPIQEPMHVGRSKVPERRHVQRGDVAHARAHLPVLLPDRLHGQLLRDRSAHQRVQGQPLPERSHVHPHQPLRVQMHVSARMER